MLMNIVGARTRTVSLRGHVCVVAIYQDIGISIAFFERLGDQISRPEDAAILGLGRPCLLRFTVEAVDKNYVDLGIWMCIDCRYVETGDLLVNRSLLYSPSVRMCSP